MTYFQRKRKPVEATFDLRDTPALLELLRGIPEENRVGPVLICETTRLPWRYRHYTETFRKIARAAGVPDDIWSMDMQAGGATEAGKLVGVSMMDLQATGGWTDPKMPARYTRDRVTRAQNLVRLRQASRANGSEQNIGTDRNALTDEGKKANRNK